MERSPGPGRGHPGLTADLGSSLSVAAEPEHEPGSFGMMIVILRRPVVLLTVVGGAGVGDVGPAALIFAAVVPRSGGRGAD